jgi:hypothetical protein
VRVAVPLPPVTIARPCGPVFTSAAVFPTCVALKRANVCGRNLANQPTAEQGDDVTLDPSYLLAPLDRTAKLTGP